MVENTKTSAFPAVVGRLEELTESELRQLHLIVGVRLGLPDATKGSSGGKSSKKGSAGGSKTAPGGKKGKAAKGNPARKSQWANHPLYLRYSGLKKTVEKQAKEAKTSFNAVDTAESREYRVVLSEWLSTKSSFRGRDTANEDSDEESEEEKEPAKTPAQSQGDGSKRPVRDIPTPAQPKAGPSAATGTVAGQSQKPATPKNSPPRK